MFPSPFLSCTHVSYPGLDEHDQVLIEDDIDQEVGHTGQGEQVVKNLQTGPCVVTSFINNGNINHSFKWEKNQEIY